jgi:WD40 repeat protein
MYLAPNGKYFLTLDEIPGEFEASRPRALSLWDSATGKYRQVVKGNAYPGAFSSDSRLVAVRMPAGDEENYAESIRLFAVPEWEEKCKIRLEGKFVEADPGVFAADSRILAGTVRAYEQANDWQHFAAALKLWDVASGEEVLTIPGQAKEIVATTYARQTGAPESVVIVDVAKKTWKIVKVGPRAVNQPQFRPGGKWLAVTTFPVISIAQARAAAPEDQPQPHIDLIDLASGQIVESLVAPQGSGISSAFSPDGQILATSGKGEVLLWDFLAPPGAPRLAKPR